MLELAAGVLFVLTISAIELYYIRTRQPTISEHVQALFRAFPPVGVLTGFAMGWFACHFFS